MKEPNPLEKIFDVMETKIAQTVEIKFNMPIDKAMQVLEFVKKMANVDTEAKT